MTTVSAPSTAPTPGLWPVRLVFMMEAVILGAWFPRIPDIKDKLDMDAGMLGLMLLGLPVGTLIGFMFAARVVRSVGLRQSSMYAGAAFALTFIAPALAGSTAVLFPALVLNGIVVALIEVAMNTKAGELERIADRRIMVQCHGFWSIGSVIGALIGGAVAQAGMSVEMQFLAFNPLFAVAAFVAGWMMTPDQPRRVPAEPGRFFVLPSRALVILCLMPIGIMAGEGAFMDWSAVFVREVLAGEPIEAAMAYAVFATMMAVMRLAGDRLAERFGAVQVVLASSLSAAAGIALFAAAPNLPIAIAGAFLAGSGVAAVYPLAVSAAAAAPGKSAENNVAAVSFIAFSAFLVAPPLIGTLTDHFGLRVALGILVPAALVSAAMSGSVRIGSREQPPPRG